MGGQENNHWATVDGWLVHGDTIGYDRALEALQELGKAWPQGLQGSGYDACGDRHDRPAKDPPFGRQNT